MPWDIQTNTLTLDGDTEFTLTRSLVLKQQCEKFPLLSASLTEDNARTYTLTVAYSLDNETYITLVTNAGMTSGSTYSLNDLSDESGHPSGAPYLRLTITASGPVGAGTRADLEVKTAHWLEDQEFEGALH